LFLSREEEQISKVEQFPKNNLMNYPALSSYPWQAKMREETEGCRKYCDDPKLGWYQVGIKIRLERRKT
jgi:hypothetical protein